MPDITKLPLHFTNNRKATAIFPAPDSTLEAIIASLQLTTPQAVILSIGGANELAPETIPRLTQLYGRGIARAAAESNAVVIDGGTDAGVMALMGEGIAARGNRSALIGVAPADLVSYPGNEQQGKISLEPNHSHFVLVQGSEWGSETGLLFQLVQALASGQPAGQQQFASADATRQNKHGKIPVLAILSGGGTVSIIEVLQLVRQNIPLIIVEGSGGLADKIASACQQDEGTIDDPVMAEIVADGKLRFHALHHSVKGMERLIVRELGTDKILQQAWETFAAYDGSANIQQRRFDKLQLSIMLIGVLGVALVIIQQVFAPRETTGELLPVSLPQVGRGWWLVYHLLIVIPILLTVLVTATNRFKHGNKWLLLRAGAESIKREIYRYRTSTLKHKTEAGQKLSKAVEQITRRTMRTEVNLSALTPLPKGAEFPPYINTNYGDDGFSHLTPDQYVNIRLADQLGYFQNKTLKLEKLLTLLQWLTFIVGGIGTYMAAIGMQAWVALSTSIVAAFGTYLGYRQTENTLQKYNQSATDLANIKSWWDALSSEEQASRANIDSLVDHTEGILQSELDGWIQQMQNALAGLRKTQEQTVTENEGRVQVIVQQKKARQETVQVATTEEETTLVVSEAATENGQALTEEELRAEEVTGKPEARVLVLEGEGSGTTAG